MESQALGQTMTTGFIHQSNTTRLLTLRSPFHSHLGYSKQNNILNFSTFERNLSRIMADFTLERRIAVLADLSTRFDRISVPYKSVNDTPIEAAIFVPKAISSSTETEQVPVLVHFHGGALIMGANPEPYFLADWFVTLHSPHPDRPSNSPYQGT